MLNPHLKSPFRPGALDFTGGNLTIPNTYFFELGLHNFVVVVRKGNRKGVAYLDVMVSMRTLPSFPLPVIA